MSTKIVARITEMLRDRSVAGPVSGQAVLQAEDALGVIFPTSYRLFLLNFGSGTIGLYEIFGLSEVDSPDGPPLWRSVVQETTRSRKAGRGSIPNEYVAFTSDGQGCKFYLDTARTDATGECHVIAWGPGVEGVVVASSFFEFIDRASQGFRLTT